MLTLLCAIAAAQPKRQTVAVLPAVVEDNALDPQGLVLLTDRVREIAANTLPMDRFTLLQQDAIVARLGEEELFRVCKEGTCVAEITRMVGTDYGARCDIFKRDDNYLLKFELYGVQNKAIVEIFTQYDIKNFREMLDVLDRRLPAAFNKIIIAAEKSTGAHETAAAAPPPAVSGEALAVEKTLADGREKMKELEEQERVREAQRLESERAAQKTQSAKRKKALSLGTAIGLDLAGAGLAAYGVYQDGEAKKKLDEYKYSDAEKSMQNRNIGYIVGGALLLTGISFHIFF